MTIPKRVKVSKVILDRKKNRKKTCEKNKITYPNMLLSVIIFCKFLGIDLAETISKCRDNSLIIG
jgi:hypothetical protein